MSTSKNQVVRMLALVPYLQGHGGIPLKQVAAEFGVSDKQIRRDLTLLMYCGPGQYPGELIDFDLGALDEDGIIFIRGAEFLTRPLKLNTSEAVALIVALRTLRASASGPQTAIIDSTLAKLESVIGDEASAPVDVHVEAVDSAIHNTLTEAIRVGKRVAITYATVSRDEKTEREIDPRRLFSAQGKLYCEAWCLRADDIRFFRLDRILSATATDHDIEEHNAEPRDLSDGLFQVDDDTIHAVLDLQPNAHWLTEYYQVESLGEPVDGIWRVKLFGADWSWLRRLVLRNGGSVTVVEPATLATEVAESAALALHAYDELV
ncbi:MAG: WYL domain-containing protein [Kineosporiaceae bacterium]|nr:WYL domain-containing protein [Aeromicrobium sp.]